MQKSESMFTLTIKKKNKKKKKQSERQVKRKEKDTNNNITKTQQAVFSYRNEYLHSYLKVLFFWNFGWSF